MSTEEQYIKQFEKSKENAEIEYARLIKEDEGKTFMDILPPEFKNFKRSIIKREIIEHIKHATEFLNNSPLHKGKDTFTELQVTRFMLAKRGNYSLAMKFIPPRNTMEIYLDPELKKLSENEKDKLYEVYEERSRVLSFLGQTWDAWLQQLAVKNGTAREYELEANGIPRTGRGAICCAFTPIKGKWPINKKGTFEVTNPRTKKRLSLKIESFVSDENVYICLNDNGEKIFLIQLADVEEAWSCLFPINKEIFGGWWKRILISEEK